MDYVDIGRRIRIQRRQLNLTQGELAKLIGVSSSFIGHLERGTRQASLETLVALANELHFTILGLTFSPVKGPEGNIEFLAKITVRTQDEEPVTPEVIRELVSRAHTEM